MTRKASTGSEQTRRAILLAAEEEFCTLGFEKASLRTICNKAGVTTGALYGMWGDKEALFACVAAPITEAVTEALRAHFEQEARLGLTNHAAGEQADLALTEQLLTLYSAHPALCDMLLANRERPCVAAFFDAVIGMMQAQMARMAAMLPENAPGREKFNECTLHWLAHTQVESVLHILSHKYPPERAREQMAIVVAFLRSGVLGLAFQPEVSGQKKEVRD